MMKSQNRLVWDFSARVCNTMTTRVIVGQSTLSSSAVKSTKLPCPGEKGKLEAKLSTLLSTLTKMKVKTQTSIQGKEGENSDYNSRKDSTFFTN